MLHDEGPFGIAQRENKLARTSIFCTISRDVLCEQHVVVMYFCRDNVNSETSTSRISNSMIELNLKKVNPQRWGSLEAPVSKRKSETLF